MSGAAGSMADADRGATATIGGGEGSGAQRWGFSFCLSILKLSTARRGAVGRARPRMRPADLMRKIKGGGPDFAPGLLPGFEKIAGDPNGLAADRAPP